MTTQIEMSLADCEWQTQVAPIVIQKLRGKEFTADSLHGLIPEPTHHNAYGALINSMAKKKLIEKTGECVTSNRKQRNGGLLRVWRVR